jgi:hypothetical protein
VTDMAQAAPLRDLRTKYFDNATPASTFVQIGALARPECYHCKQWVEQGRPTIAGRPPKQLSRRICRRRKEKAELRVRLDFIRSG